MSESFENLLVVIVDSCAASAGRLTAYFTLRGASVATVDDLPAARRIVEAKRVDLAIFVGDQKERSAHLRRLFHQYGVPLIYCAGHTGDVTDERFSFIPLSEA